MESKQCSKCKETKALSEFNTRPDRPSGYRSECKQCQYATHRKRELSQRYKIRAKDNALVALRKGRIQKPLFCQRCYKAKPLDKHHPDYKNQLKVEWLCRKCHTKAHAEMGSYNKAI